MKGTAKSLTQIGASLSSLISKTKETQKQTFSSSAQEQCSQQENFWQQIHPSVDCDHK